MTSKFGMLKLAEDDDEGAEWIKEQLLEEDEEWDEETMGLPNEARVIFQYGKDKSGYWDNKYFILQIKKSILIFERTYPEYKGVWIFDNSSGSTHSQPLPPLFSLK